MISAMNTLAFARSSHLSDQVSAMISVEWALKLKHKYWCVNLAARIGSAQAYTAFRSQLTKSKSRNSTHFCTISGGKLSKVEAMASILTNLKALVDYSGRRAAAKIWLASGLKHTSKLTIATYA